MTMSHGGRVTNVLEAPPPPPPEGLVLPPVRRVTDTSGRIFLFFVDDLHLQFQNSGRVRELFKKIARNLVHDGDLFGIVSSGPSSIAIDMTYDKKRLDEAINKIAGSGLKPSEIIQRGSGSEGPTELRYNAHVAFSTMREGLENLEKVHNRRKALVWVSEGYDFNPFQDARVGLRDSEFAVPAEPVELDAQRIRTTATARTSSQPTHGPSAASRARRSATPNWRIELGEITRSRQPRQHHDLHHRPTRAGARIRHRRAGRSDRVEQLRAQVAGQHARSRRGDRRRRVCVNMNDFDKALKQYRRGEQRLLRARLLLEQSRCDQARAASSK
jgi:hypothetical protein